MAVDFDSRKPRWVSESAKAIARWEKRRRSRVLTAGLISKMGLYEVLSPKGLPVFGWV